MAKKKDPNERLLKLVEKAIEVVDTAMDRITEASRNNVKVDVSFDAVQSKARLELLKNRIIEDNKKGKLTKVRLTELHYLKEASKPTYYDKLIKYKLVTQEQVGSMTRDKEINISQYDINKIRNREAKGNLITSEEQTLIMQWSDITSVSNNYHNVPILQTDENIRQFIIQNRRKRLDLSFGGQSSLLNDLAYSQNIEVARDFVEWLRNIMKDKRVFAALEKWYNTEPEGQSARYIINLAKGRNWYKNYKKFAEMMVETIDKLNRSLSLKAPDALKEKAEATAAEVTED